MASRLSGDAAKAALDSGYRGLAIAEDPAHALVVADLRTLAMEPFGKDVIAQIPPQKLYHSILTEGFDDCREVVALATPEQLQRFLDYDAWDEDRMVPQAAARWLQAAGSLDPTQTFVRFMDLEEEYQLSLLYNCISLVDNEELEKLAPEDADFYIPLPCHTLFYRPTCDDTYGAFIEQLIGIGLGVDINYTYSLLQHAVGMIPNETEHLLLQFRNARLEEDGFVTWEESQRMFFPLPNYGETPYKPAAVEARGAIWDRAVASLDNSGSWTPSEREMLERGLVTMANTLAAATGVSPSDIDGFRRVLQQAVAIASLGLDDLAQGQMARAAELLRTNHPTHLLRIGLTVAYRARDRVLASLQDYLGPDPLESIRTDVSFGRYGQAMARCDSEGLAGRIGFFNAEILKGLCNRFPLRPAAKVLNAEGHVVRINFKTIDSVNALQSFTQALSASLSGIAAGEDFTLEYDVSTPRSTRDGATIHDATVVAAP